jgi:isopenicillin-N epimerase
METRPVEYQVRRMATLLSEARRPLASFLGADLQDMAWVENSTFAMNWVAWSLELEPGSEILLNDHEYGAVWRTWKVVAAQRGWKLRQAQLSLDQPALDLQAALADSTQVVVLSHITSPTAQLFPIAEMAQPLRSRGIRVVVDGAHAPGQVDLDLGRLGVDFYMGNFHKWLWAPKGSAFLWVAPERQQELRPLIVSWAVDSPVPLEEPEWLAHLHQQATRDVTPFLATPAGLQYQRRYHLPLQEATCWARMEWLSGQLEQLGAQPLPWQRPLKLRSFGWPFAVGAAQLQNWLFEKWQIEIPCFEWNGQLMFRVSLQHYVGDPELERLLSALSEARVATRSL